MMTHFSFSSILLFLHNKSAWYNKYCLGVRDQKTNSAALTGSAFHKYMEMLLKGHPPNFAIAEGRRMIDTVDNIEWGKTGSREKSLRDYMNLVENINKEWDWNKDTVGVEVGIFTQIKGIKIPLNAYIDYIYRDEAGNFKLVDWKTVSAYAEYPKPAHVFQAVFYYWAVDAYYGVKPKDFQIVQIKASANKDGSSQVKPLLIVYEDHPEYFQAVKQITKQVLKEANKKTTAFLPNIRDEYEGESEWNRYLENLNT